MGKVIARERTCDTQWWPETPSSVQVLDVCRDKGKDVFKQNFCKIAAFTLQTLSVSLLLVGFAPPAFGQKVLTGQRLISRGDLGQM